MGSLKALEKFQGLRVLIVGLAREGEAAARFFVKQGAKVSITDLQSTKKLIDRVKQVENVTFHLGHHPTTLLDEKQIDLILVSPGVPMDSPFLREARDKGFCLTSEPRLFTMLCPAPIVGISGSSGKTTTTTLVGKMLEASAYTTYIGGNIGQPLLEQVAAIKPTDQVVMELSSFQLAYFHPSSIDSAVMFPELAQGWSPQVGALLNITPNHLDRHKSMTAYIQAKRALVEYMDAEQVLILGLDNPITRDIGQSVSAQVRWFSLQAQVDHGACLRDQQVMLVKAGQSYPVCFLSDIKLRGQHNVYNVLAACAIADAAGANLSALTAIATSFTGVAYRLEPVGEIAGVSFINDSIATSPERLMAALHSFEQPLILLVGGKDKDLPWTEAAQLIVQRAKHVILFGQAQALIHQALTAQQRHMPITCCDTLPEAVTLAYTKANPGDMVLFSPGCTSYDAYPDFVARGDHFRQLVQALGTKA